ncbi:MAG: hypothetical protein ACP5NV_01460 [Candidatus Woesearchaeota archaeon]
MVSLTLSIPEELKARMDKHSEINWSEVARQAIMQKVEDFEMLKKLSEKSRLTEKDALEIGRKISQGMSKRLREMRKNEGRG